MPASLLDASSLAAGNSCAMFTMCSCTLRQDGLPCKAHAKVGAVVQK